MKTTKEKENVLSLRADANGADNVLHHYWHPVARSGDLTDKPLAVKLLDQPVVIWRSAEGVVAFYDLCIHRGTPLSLGWVDKGRLVCAYHGWQYGAETRCQTRN